LQRRRLDSSSIDHQLHCSAARPGLLSIIVEIQGRELSSSVATRSSHPSSRIESKFCKFGVGRRKLRRSVHKRVTGEII
jgi:hypothetical protein